MSNDSDEQGDGNLGDSTVKTTDPEESDEPSVEKLRKEVEEKIRLR